MRRALAPRTTSWQAVLAVATLAAVLLAQATLGAGPGVGAGCGFACSRSARPGSGDVAGFTLTLGGTRTGCTVGSPCFVVPGSAGTAL